MRLAKNESDARTHPTPNSEGVRESSTSRTRRAGSAKRWNALHSTRGLINCGSAAGYLESLAKSRNRLQEKPIHLRTLFSSAYLWSFSNCFLTLPFSWRTSLSWLWRSGSWDFCGFGWWPLCLPCRYSGPGCFASPICSSRAFSSC